MAGQCGRCRITSRKVNVKKMCKRDYGKSGGAQLLSGSTAAIKLFIRYFIEWRLTVGISATKQDLP